MPSNPKSPICCPTKKDYPNSPTNKLRTRMYPPTDGCVNDVGHWQWINNSGTYRKKVKKSIEMIQWYKLITTGSDHLDRRDKDAVHRLLESLTFDANRRIKTDGGAKEILADSIGVSI